MKHVSHVLKIILTSILVIMILVFVYVCFLILSPQKDTDTQEALRLTPSPSVTLESVSGLESMIAAFPAPVLCASQTSGWPLLGGISEDLETSEGLKRSITLQYGLPSGDVLTLQSITPAMTSPLDRGDQELVSTTVYSLGGLHAILMETFSEFTLYASSTDGLYTVTLPVVDPSTLKEICQMLQLFTAST